MSRAFQDSLRLVHTPNRQQRGVTMIVVLLMLVLVSMLALVAARFSILGEKSARNDRDRDIAFQAAEDALLDAEKDVLHPGPIPAPGNRNSLFGRDSQLHFQPGCGINTERGLCLPNDIAIKPIWLTVDISASSTTSVQYGTYTGQTYPSGLVLSVRPPRYIVEVIPDIQADSGQDAQQGCYIYRVTSFGFGVREETIVSLQNILRPRENCPPLAGNL
jgi:type IV pilus assembly protein PilX